MHDRVPADDGGRVVEPLSERERPLIVIADDQALFREALEELFASVGMDTLCFENADGLLSAALPDRPGCFILDVRMPGLSGLDLQVELSRTARAMPIIFLTGHGDVPMSIRAMKAGAFEFKTKPVSEQDLLDAVSAAVDADRASRAEDLVTRECAAKLEALSARERQVLRLIVNGLLNKQIAYELGVTEVTVKLHRGNVMRKTGARSVAELVRLWDRLPEGLRPIEAG
ncbi:response regulator transcription factor [Novosphingobium kaempferiae]|uniref:response regulator transcription factor n=1 Tax=Novosphingobium kaempferiae TaxID=2896849 RepID=UPI001E54AF44|nr:response regulator [Novosphingobium kaempferiae]